MTLPPSINLLPSSSSSPENGIGFFFPRLNSFAASPQGGINLNLDTQGITSLFLQKADIFCYLSCSKLGIYFPATRLGGLLTN